IPSRTWPKAVRPRPHPRRPMANATPAAALAPKAAHVNWAGESPSVTWQSRSTGRTARSRARPTAGAKSYMTSIPEEECVPHEQRGEHHTLLHLVGDRREPSPGDPGRVGIERRLHGVIHVHAEPEGAGEHQVAALEIQRLRAESGGEEMRDDGHGTAARSAAGRRPASHTRPIPAPIQTRSLTRLTIAV